MTKDKTKASEKALRPHINIEIKNTVFKSWLFMHINIITIELRTYNANWLGLLDNAENLAKPVNEKSEINKRKIIKKPAEPIPIAQLTINLGGDCAMI